MAKPLPTGPFAGGFTIQAPADGGTVTVGATGVVLVQVLDQGDGPPFSATITDTTGLITYSGPTILTSIGSNQYSLQMSVGSFTDPPVGTMNRKVSVTSPTGNPISHSFRAVHLGSGSDIQAAAATPPAALAQMGKPVPAALSLQLNTSLTSADSDPLSRPTTLLYSGNPGPDCCWLSQPIDSWSDQADAAFWMLTTNDARTWILFLRRGKTDVVVYQFTTPGEKAGSLPIQLYLVVGGEGRNWPQTVTLSPAT